MYTPRLATVLSLAGSILGAAIRTTTSTCGAVPGLTAYANTDFSGYSVQFNAPAWGTCTSIAAQFPAGTSAGVTSLVANPHNSCILYPNTNCDPGTTGNADDTLFLIGSYYDLGEPEYTWDNKAQSFKCSPYNNC